MLLLLNCFFCIKSYCFVGNYAQIFKKGNEYSTEEENDQNAKKEQIMKAKAVQQKLILYPLFTVILFIFIIYFDMCFTFLRKNYFSAAVVDYHHPPPLTHRRGADLVQEMEQNFLP